jgi:hypothetical protein
MADTFNRKIDELIREVGTGRITARCEVNQPYAQNQHQSVWFNHPHGGRSMYLGGPLLENALDLVASIARSVLTPSGPMIRLRMIEIAETLARYVLENAPKETGQLSLSGHPSVTDNGVVIYDRPSIAPREPD